MPTMNCKYAIGEKVHIDNDGSIAGVITSIEWRRPDVVRYEISWLCGGKAEFTIFDEWRLTPC